jgi:mono/diheme cytochrome c family protein
MVRRLLVLALVWVAVACDATGRAEDGPASGVGPAAQDAGAPLPVVTLPPRSDVHHCAPDPEALPEWLSETGCFADVATLTPAPDLVPYEINAPLWSDGTGKRRWMALPPGTAVEVGPDGALVWPVGAVLLKAFESEARPIELRIMAKAGPEPHDWRFAGYRMTDADGERVEDWRAEPVDVDGQRRTWLYPEAKQCAYCHDTQRATDSRRMVLGPTPAQLERAVRTADGVYDQLDALTDIGMLATRPRVAEVMPDPTEPSAPLEARARAYLHANCAHCHQPGGWTPPDMTLDLRYDTPLSEAVLCDAPLQYTSFFAPGWLRLAPGAPEDSNIWTRMWVTGEGRMPPLGTGAVDEVGAEVVRAWIASMRGCP